METGLQIQPFYGSKEQDKIFKHVETEGSELLDIDCSSSTGSRGDGAKGDRREATQRTGHVQSGFFAVSGHNQLFREPCPPGPPFGITNLLTAVADSLMLWPLRWGLL